MKIRKAGHAQRSRARTCTRPLPQKVFQHTLVLSALSRKGASTCGMEHSGKERNQEELMGHTGQ